MLLLRSPALDPSSPVPFGDGLRCVAAPLVRLGEAGRFASGGQSLHSFGHAPSAGAGAFFYQLWFRSRPRSFCDDLAAFNLSNGRQLTW